MSRLVIRGAAAAAPRARCSVCGVAFGPFESARLVDGRRLAHRVCPGSDPVAGPARCSVCDELAPAASLDPAGRCDPCQP